jgi:two-component system OmpR family sensor kinase
VGSHGGSVRVENTDGGGATLVVTLPHRDDAPGNESADGAEAECLGSAPRPAGSDARGSDGRVIHI